MLKQPLLPWASQDIFNMKVKAFFTHTRQGPHPSLKEFMCLFEFICYPTIVHEKCTVACRTCQYSEFLLERNLSHLRSSSVNSSSLIIFKLGSLTRCQGYPDDFKRLNNNYSVSTSMNWFSHIFLLFTVGSQSYFWNVCPSQNEMVFILHKSAAKESVWAPHKTFTSSTPGIMRSRRPINQCSILRVY